MSMHGDAQTDSDEALVRCLLRRQFPQWSDMPVTRLQSDGTDNAVYRIGDDLVARLPLAEWAVEQVVKEHQWLPTLAQLLPLSIPEPLAIGEPDEGYPWQWAVHRWIDGQNAHADLIRDMREAVGDLCAFLFALHAIDIPDAPICPRANPLTEADELTRWAIDQLHDEFDTAALTAIWEAALAAPPWTGPPVLVHGDLTDGNILMTGGRVNAVIDWNLFGLAEPANDLDVAWDLFSGPWRAAFRAELGIDDDTWTRARGWAVRSVMGVLYYRDSNPGIVTRCRRRLHAVLEDAGA